VADDAHGSDQRILTTAELAFGVDLGGTKIEAVVLDAAGQTLWRQRSPTPSGNYDGTLACIADLIARAEQGVNQRAQRIGVGTPGVLTHAGVMKNCNSQCLNGQPLERDLIALLKRPVRIANDANCLALSEATDGAGAGAGVEREVVFAAILGTGVGAGVVVNGALLSGPNGLAGEWGHNPLPWANDSERPGWACYCGQSGCVETWLSGPGMARDHEAATGVSLSAQAIAAQADQGDVACEATMQRYESRLARALAGVINLLDPHVIVLGGGVSQPDRLLVNVPKLWGHHVFSGSTAAAGKDPVRTKLHRSVHGDSSGVRGAAWLWKNASA
jgi:fructokinase